MSDIHDKIDIVPLIQFMSGHDDIVHRGIAFIRWCDRARSHLLQHEPLLAIYINEHYSMPYLNTNYAILDVNEAIHQFSEMDSIAQEGLMTTFHHIADLVIIYVGEGPFTSHQWDERVRTYLQSFVKEGASDRQI